MTFLEHLQNVLMWVVPVVFLYAVVDWWIGK